LSRRAKIAFDHPCSSILAWLGEIQLALSKQQILDLPGLHDHIQVQSRSLIGMFEHDSRLSAVFATQQRWLMSHVGLSLYFRNIAADPDSGFYISGFLDAVSANGIASRNTADSYIKELEKYKYILSHTDPGDKRLRPLMPAASVIEAFGGWLQIHLASLDSLAGGHRLVRFHQDPSMLARMQPVIADALIHAQTVRNPEKTFSLFTWLDNGGLVMDWLITSLAPAPLETERVPAGEFSIVEMAARLNLSRTHLSRKLRQAEALGSIGWEGRRGHSVMWVSRGFRLEYASAQAVKLSIIDRAFETVSGQA
jgi:hypothetical protein